MIINSLNLISNICYGAQNNKISASKAKFPNIQQLDRDTVSFTAGKKIKDDLYAQHIKSINKYRVEANQYIAALASVADDLKAYGVSFDIDGAKANAVKSTERVIEKVESSKSFDIRDKIRATIYVKDPYDKDFIVNTFIPKMSDYGYVLYKKDGKADIDFRLEGLGGPTKSGYEDIQMRFVKSGNSKNKTKHELIIVFGPEYRKAKHLEHEQVFSHTRKFKNLSVYSSSARPNTREFVIMRFINLITEKFNSDVSRPLYTNAKNKEYFNIKNQERIRLTKEDEKLVAGYFNSLQDQIKLYYDDMRSKTADPGRRKALNKIKLADYALLREIKSGLDETLSLYMKN